MGNTEFPVQLSPLRPVNRTSCVYKSATSDSRAIAEYGSTVSDISGRHPYHAPEQGCSCAANLDGDRLAGITWFPGELQEVSDSSMSGDNIPRLCIGLNAKDQAPPRKSEADTGRGTSPSKSEGVSQDAGSVHRKAVRGYLSSSAALPQPTTSQTRALKASSYDTPISISPPAREDLQWWVQHLGNWNGRTIQTTPPELVIETDASKTGWGAYSQGEFTGGCWSKDEKMLHINDLELMAATFLATVGTPR